MPFPQCDMILAATVAFKVRVKPVVFETDTVEVDMVQAGLRREG